MGKRIGTKQRKTHHKFKGHYSAKGKLPLSRYLQEFKVGDKVDLKIFPNVQKGRFYPRFHGLSGKVVGMKGACYAVQIKDGDKEKKLYVHPIHLKKA